MEYCLGAECTFATHCTKDHLLHHIRNNISTKITYDMLNILPSRKDFIDSNINKLFESQLQRRQPIIFMPNTTTEKNDWVDGRLKYRIYIYGVLPCGSKTCVILSDVDVCLDVLVPNGTTSHEYQDILRNQLMDKNINYTKITDIKYFKLRGFQKNKSAYKRIFFDNLQERKRCIEYFKNFNIQLTQAGKAPIETASDDTGRCDYYFSKVARENKFATADWNRIEVYELLDSSKITTNCAYTLSVKLKDYVKLSKSRRENIVLNNPTISKTIDQDPTMVGMWDIETHRTIQNGLVPTVNDVDFTIFMICSAYYHHYTDQPLLEVCVVDKASNVRKGIRLIIECGIEVNVLDAHMEIMGRMAPDILGAFNGANFDWPLYKEKLRRNGLLVKLKSKLSSIPLIKSGKYADTEKSISDWNFYSTNVKIDADSKHAMACVANFAGVLDTDVLPVFLKLHPKTGGMKSSSLNYFLAKYGLRSKEDMPYKKMFKIYERACKLSSITSCHCNATHDCATCIEHIKELDYETVYNKETEEFEYSNTLRGNLLDSDREKCCFCGKKTQSLRDMADVGYYCVIDCSRPQELYVKATIVQGKRELSTMSCVSLRDSFEKADGMKVCNLIGKYCNKYDIAFSNAKSNKPNSDKDHYPGAWIFPPNRGLHSDGILEIEVVADGVKKILKKQARPLTALDFASLYPSLMMTYNLSIDTIVYTKEDAEQLVKEGYTLHHINPFKYEKGEKKDNPGNRQLIGEGWTVRHNGIFNPKVDKNIISEYRKYECFSNSTEVIKYDLAIGPTPEQAIRLKEPGASYVRRVTYQPIYGRNALEGERMGIFSFIVKKIFDKRVPIKAEFIRLSKIKEQMDLNKLATYSMQNAKGATIVYTYNDIIFILNKVESKQRALKILANTFYGKSGDFRSPVYELLVAAGVTCAGQETIKKTAKFVEDLGFTVHYGDTDSIYISCPDELFAECDNEYRSEMQDLSNEFSGQPVENDPLPSTIAYTYKQKRIAARTKWWTAQVKISMKVINDLKELIADYLLKDNGTCFLTVSYEEVGMPTLLCGKKKYALVPHIATINFYPKDYLVKGIETVKQGHAPITKSLGDEFISEALSIENERGVIEIANDKIRKFYTMDANVSMFILNAKYKPDKHNVPVKTFVKRMEDLREKHSNNPNIAALYEPPEAGDKFDYVIVKKNDRYTWQGHKIDIKKGDRMEYVRVYKASQSSSNPMLIDVDYYMRKMIVGVFARFIAYYDNFQPPANMFTTTDRYAMIDEYCINEATKYLLRLCDEFSGRDNKLALQTGRDYRKIYKNANKIVIADILQKHGYMGYIIYNINIHEENNPLARSTKVIKQLIQLAENITAATVRIGTEFVRKMGLLGYTPFKLKHLYINSRSINLSYVGINICNDKIKQLTEQLYKIAALAVPIIDKYENNLISLIENMRAISATDFEMDDIELNNLNSLTDGADTLKEIYSLTLALISTYIVKADILSVVDTIEQERAKIARTTRDPNINTSAIALCESHKAPIIPDHTWA